MVGAIIARFITYDRLAQIATIFGVFIAFLMSCALMRDVAFIGMPIDLYEYTWLSIGALQIDFGLWLDALSLIMMVIITSVSLLVHIYSLGYMAGDSNQSAYFSYVSFFTFAMLLLVMSNNLLQLFFGWEGVGVASYLLIGFWQQKDYPANASIKAFIVIRVGDMGLLIAIGLTLVVFRRYQLW